MIEMIRNNKASCCLQSFSSNPFPSPLLASRQPPLKIVIPNYCDIMQPFSIDIPPWEIKRITFVDGNSVAFFRSMDEASYYFHYRLLGNRMEEMYVTINLQPGVFRGKCNMVWKCYFIPHDIRDQILQNKDKVVSQANKVFSYDGGAGKFDLHLLKPKL